MFRAKIEKEWVEWELAYPKETRGYSTTIGMHTKEMIEVQRQWQTKWFKTNEKSLKLYYESPHHMCTDLMTYYPTPQIYRWEDFEQKK